MSAYEWYDDDRLTLQETAMTQKQRNIQRMKLALFIPWDKDGRIYLGDNEFITKDTEFKDNSGGMVKSDKGITLVRKKP